MYHRQRWTAEKIRQRLELIAPLVYPKHVPLPPFRYRVLETPTTPPPIEINIDDSHWPEISANEYWGAWDQDFVLRTTFTVPDNWVRVREVK